MIKRILEEKIRDLLNISGAVLVYGVRDVGKATLCASMSKTIIKLDDELSQQLKKLLRTLNLSLRVETYFYWWVTAISTNVELCS